MADLTATMKKLIEQAEHLKLDAPAQMSLTFLVEVLKGRGFNVEETIKLSVVFSFLNTLSEGKYTAIDATANMMQAATNTSEAIERGDIPNTYH